MLVAPESGGGRRPIAMGSPFTSSFASTFCPRIKFLLPFVPACLVFRGFAESALHVLQAAIDLYPDQIVISDISNAFNTRRRAQISPSFVLLLVPHSGAWLNGLPVPILLSFS